MSHNIVFAPTSRTTCNECGKNINKGNPRLDIKPQFFGRGNAGTERFCTACIIKIAYNMNLLEPVEASA